ncbi:hypothetical protein BO99DRAFT_477941 [Aspergillus violaceofuscus CBS 115571]|uniref:Amino acid permease/ SLC12A domain-containing protein n=1 Tax=Aspergillus violaceofuscus (strain CBS 115571) TaxID=1450538 RepID=A0A2V5GQ08_ASPV1|nr:hypothetical protein BO99DRAFT_477941 [Aspergillus violaceofuscus CBS 115571]
MMNQSLNFKADGMAGDKDLNENDIQDNGASDEIASGRTQKYGNVQRELKARHVNFIALGGNLGTGLFLGIGRALRKSGPLSLFLGYAIASFAGFMMMMMALGEMAAWLPVPGAIPQFCSRYVDDALGFAVGWNTCVPVWVVVLIVSFLALNILAVKVYGESEFACAVIKLCGILGLLITALVIDLGGVSSQNRLGFHYWKSDDLVKEYIASGATGGFLGLFSTLVNASFSLGGVETVVVAAGEAENPRRNIPRAIRLLFWHVLLFFVLASLALGMIRPSNNPKLLGASSLDNVESPWVIAIQLAGIRALPSITNAVVLIAGISAGNSYVFKGSRYLFALASNRQALAIFLQCTKRGIPIYALLVTMSISLLTFMSMGSSLSVVFSGSRILPPFLACFTLGYLCVVTFFNGFDTIAGGFDTAGFITSYVGFPLFFSMFLFWKFARKTKWKQSEKADLFTGKAELDAIEWTQKVPKDFR